LHVATNRAIVISRLKRNLAPILMLGLVLIAVSTAQGDSRRIGDRLQYFLPLAGFGCAAATGKGVQYAGRFLLMETALHGTRHALGDSAINRRPNGRSLGFPSGHTTAATFGATGLIQSCLAGSKPAQVVAILSAGFVGGSRIEAGRHDVWQVLGGWILGVLVQVLALRRFDRAVQAAWRGILRGIGALGRPGSSALRRRQ
jgi:membrane-associated phospholipid phosphatase